MKYLIIFLGLAIFAGTAIANDVDPKPSIAENLLPNGDFNEGEITPHHWQTIDGLSTFWVDDPDPKRGKVLKFDTDVQQAQAYVWWKNISEGTSPLGAPKKLPTVEPKYDTLAGLDGVWFWSDAIPVEKGAPARGDPRRIVLADSRRQGCRNARVVGRLSGEAGLLVRRRRRGGSRVNCQAKRHGATERSQPATFRT